MSSSNCALQKSFSFDLILAIWLINQTLDLFKIPYREMSLEEGQVFRFEMRMKVFLIDVKHNRRTNRIHLGSSRTIFKDLLIPKNVSNLKSSMQVSERLSRLDYFPFMTEDRIETYLIFLNNTFHKENPTLHNKHNVTWVSLIPYPISWFILRLSYHLYQFLDSFIRPGEEEVDSFDELEIHL
jgi:hypothetical protein